MRLINKRRWIRTFLAAILIISMAGQSLTTYAATEMASDATKYKYTEPNNAGNNLWSDEGWVVSIQTVENTATGASSSYAQSDISFENAWLHDFPDEYIDGIYQSPDSYAYIKHDSSVSHKYRVASPTGNKFTEKLVSSYASGSGTNDFETAAQLLEANSTTYNNILVGLQTFGEALDVDTLYAAAGDMSAAINSFVGLWKDSGTAATRINEFVLDDSLDHWQQTVRYLDLLLIVNSMCNRAWDKYINDYLESLNQDGSKQFVAIVVAAAANCESVDYGTQALMTLPVYYGYKTGRNPSTFSHWDGSGDFSSIQDALNNNYITSWSKMNNTNTNDIWWDRNLAASVYPLGADGSTLGYCGYTYIAPTIQFEPEEIINPPSSSSTSPTSSVAATTTVTPVFTVEVTTDDAYMQRDTSQPVTATVTIDMSQTGTVEQYFQMLYNSLKGESYTTVLEVFIERSFGDSGGTDATTVLDNNLNDFFSNYADQSGSGYPQAAMYRYESTSTDGLFDILDGIEQIQFEDTDLSLAGISEGTPMTATYHVGVRMAIYLEGTDPLDYTTASYRWIFQGTGKTVCEGSGNSDCSSTFFVVANTGISTTQSAHDDAEWICPDGVQWYSSLRDKKL